MTRTSLIHRFCPAILIAMALAGTSASAATIELITNGDFESGTGGFDTDFTNANGGFPGLATVSVVSGTYFGLSPSAGNAHLAVNGRDRATSPATVWSQDLALVAGTLYTLSFDLGGTSAAPTPVGQVSVQLNGTELLTAAAPAGPSYLSFGTTFTALSTGTFALAFEELSLGFGGNDYGLDNISLTYNDAVTTPVPLPAGGLMLLGGLAAFGWHRRKP